MNKEAGVLMRSAPRPRIDGKTRLFHSPPSRARA